jgi:hypothetical protein
VAHLVLVSVLGAAAVVMNTADMTLDVSTIRDRLPTIPVTSLDDVLRCRPSGGERAAFAGASD